MNKKTPNSQRRTPNIELRSWRVAELSDGEYGSKRKPAYNLEDRLLEFAANIINSPSRCPTLEREIT